MIDKYLVIAVISMALSLKKNVDIRISGGMGVSLHGFKVNSKSHVPSVISGPFLEERQSSFY